MSDDSAEPRLRLVAWLVQPIVMLDDGETLTPIDVSPANITAKEWATFKAGGDEQVLERIAQQIQQGPPDRAAPNQ